MTIVADEIVEKAAKALSDVEKQFVYTHSWERSDDDWKDLCRERAKAALLAVAEDLIAAEREACAKRVEGLAGAIVQLSDDEAYLVTTPTAKAIAAAIRARRPTSGTTP